MVTTNEWMWVSQHWCGVKSLFLVSPVPGFPTVYVNSHSHATLLSSRPNPTRPDLIEPLPGLCASQPHRFFTWFPWSEGNPHLQVCSQGSGRWGSLSRLNVYQGVSLASVYVSGKKAEWSKQRTQAAAQAKGQPWLMHESSPFLNGRSVLCSFVTVCDLGCPRGHDLWQEDPVPGGADSLPSSWDNTSLIGGDLGVHHSVHCMKPFLCCIDFWPFLI